MICGILDRILLIPLAQPFRPTPRSPEYAIPKVRSGLSSLAGTQAERTEKAPGQPTAPLRAHMAF